MLCPRCVGTFTGGVAVGFAPEAAVTFTFIRAGQVDTLTADAADVLLGALVHVCRAERTEHEESDNF